MTDFKPTAKVILDSISPDGHRLTDEETETYTRRATVGLELFQDYLEKCLGVEPCGYEIKISDGRGVIIFNVRPLSTPN